MSGISNDIKDYFNTTLLHLAEYWAACFVWSAVERLIPRVDGTAARQTTGRRPASCPRTGCLSGIAISSNVGQRAAELYLAISRRRLDLEERGYFEAVSGSSSGHCAGAGLSDELTRRGDRFTGACRWNVWRRTLFASHGSPGATALCGVHVHGRPGHQRRRRGAHGSGSAVLAGRDKGPQPPDGDRDEAPAWVSVRVARLRLLPEPGSRGGPAGQAHEGSGRRRRHSRRPAHHLR